MTVVVTNQIFAVNLCCRSLYT